MKQPEIFDGHLHAPFFIYFRRETKLSDEQILDHFGLHAHRYTAKLPPNSTYAVITDAGEWSLIADDWLYQLWRMPSTLNAIESIVTCRLNTDFTRMESWFANTPSIPQTLTIRSSGSTSASAFRSNRICTIIRLSRKWIVFVPVSESTLPWNETGFGSIANRTSLSSISMLAYENSDRRTKRWTRNRGWGVAPENGTDRCLS